MPFFAATTVASMPFFAATTVASEEPPSGQGSIITGWVFAVFGVAHIATIPACYTLRKPEYLSLKSGCIGLSATLAVASLGVGLPVMLLGYTKEAKRKKWQAARTSSFFGRTHVLPVRGGALGAYVLEF
jgi:hypothetical protein